MNAPIPLGVIGADRHARAVAGHDAPLSGARIARWSPSPCGQDRDGANTLADGVGAEWSPDWQTLARDPSLPAVLVLSSDPEKGRAVEAALAAGKVVLCPVPAATRADDLDRLAAAEGRGHAALISGGALRHTHAGRTALRLVADGALGTLHSAYAAVRLPRDDRAHPRRAVLEEAAWEVFDVLLTATPARVRRVHAWSGALFEAGVDDTAVSIIRFEDDLIATIELSRCLPASVPSLAVGEVELEIIGSRQAVRLEPYAAALGLLTSDAALLPWVDDPVLFMIQEVVDAVASGGGRTGAVPHLRRVAALMDTVRAAGRSAGG
ncbi:MAG TPA: Gfo/Idh/MocA family oxidoreductase [bacterium]|nr:Gfo/Idh/MocA family oxidoreductase [bacterium]